MYQINQENPSSQTLSNKNLVLIIYVLYFAGYFTLITAVVGVIIAHVQIGSSEPMLRTHYQFQIRTFWIGLLYMVVGGVLAFVGIGFLILLWWLIWSLVRCIKGLLALNEDKPIANPTSWLFG
jgi:uncharacterized membrane protein